MPSRVSSAAEAAELLMLDVDSGSGSARALELLAVLREQADPRALPALVRVRVTPSWPSTLHREVSATAAAIVARMDAVDLARLDTTLRGVGSQWSANPPDRAWTTLRASRVPAVAEGDPHAVVVLGLISGHRDGHVREAATQRLATHPGALRWLLLRVNDWVAPVRARATAAVLERFGAEPPASLLECLPLVWRLQTLGRADHRALITRAGEVAGQLGSSALRQALGHWDRRVRRAVVELLEGVAQVDPELLATAIDDEDLVVRLRAAARVPRDASAAAQGLRERLCRDSSGRLRELGLERMVDARSPRADDWLERGLDDPNRGVRETARYLVRQREPSFDFASRYRARLEQGALSPGVVRGLGETGVASDWERLVPALDVDRRTAGAALEALHRLDAVQTRELRLMMVDDPRPGVSRDAAASVADQIGESDEPVLREYLASPLPHVRRHAMDLVVGLPGWRAGLVLLGHHEASERAAQHAALSRWVSRVASYRAEVTAEDARVLRDRLGRAPWNRWSGAERVLALLDHVVPVAPVAPVAPADDDPR